MATILDETFVGSAAALTGRAPSPTQNGSDVWTDFSGSGFGTYSLTGSGGAASASLGGSSASFAGQALTGAGQDQRITIAWTASGTSANVLVHLHRTVSGSDYLRLTIGNGNAVVLDKSVSGSLSNIATTSLSLSAIPYTLVATTAGGLISVTLNGSPVSGMTGVAIPTGTGTVLLFGQTGASGNVTFTEVKVETPPYGGAGPTWLYSAQQVIGVQ